MPKRLSLQEKAQKDARSLAHDILQADLDNDLISERMAERLRYDPLRWAHAMSEFRKIVETLE